MYRCLILTMILCVTEVKSADIESTSTGHKLLTTALQDARVQLLEKRDYVGHFVRQIAVDGKMLEMTGEIRCRFKPFAMSQKVLLPQTVAGWEYSYLKGRFADKAHFRRGGKEIGRGYILVDKNDSRLAEHGFELPENAGILPLITRAEKILQTEQQLQNKIQVFVERYQFNDRECLRYEILTPRAHVQRDAYRTVIYFDKELKVPVRWESYDEPNATHKNGVLRFIVSYVNLKLNNGLGDAVFER